MPRRQVANLQFTLDSLSSGSTNTAVLSLGTPFSVFSINGIQSVSTGTYTIQLRGGWSTNLSTAAAGSVLLATIDASTSYGYNSSAIPCTHLLATASAGPSTGGNSVALTVTCAG